MAARLQVIELAAGSFLLIDRVPPNQRSQFERLAPQLKEHLGAIAVGLLCEELDVAPLVQRRPGRLRALINSTIRGRP